MSVEGPHKDRQKHVCLVQQQVDVWVFTINLLSKCKKKKQLDFMIA